MTSKEVFAIFITTILLIDSTSAGLLQTIRDAAFLGDEFLSETMRSNRDSRALGGSGGTLVVPEFSNIPSTNDRDEASSPSFFDQYTTASPQRSREPQPLLPSCAPGDFVCFAQRSMKQTLGHELSNAIIKSVASVMTEMLNTTISRSLDIVHHAQGSHDPQKEAEARAAVNMMTTAISTVSSKVIQGLASFIKVSLSGSMWDMYNQVVRAALRAPSTKPESFRTLNQQQSSLSSASMGSSGTGMSDPALVTPSNMYIPTQTNNEIKRSDVVSTE